MNLSIHPFLFLSLTFLPSLPPSFLPSLILVLPNFNPPPPLLPFFPVMLSLCLSLSLRLSFYLSIYLSICLYPSIYLSIYLSISLCFSVSLYLSIYLSLSLSICCYLYGAISPSHLLTLSPSLIYLLSLSILFSRILWHQIWLN